MRLDRFVAQATDPEVQERIYALTREKTPAQRLERVIQAHVVHSRTAQIERALPRRQTGWASSDVARSMDIRGEVSRGLPEERSLRVMKWILAVNVGILICVFFLGSLLNQRAPHQWEYKVEEMSETGFSDRINLLGRQGWEMISVRPEGGEPPTGSSGDYEVIFKRPIR